MAFKESVGFIPARQSRSDVLSVAAQDSLMSTSWLIAITCYPGSHNKDSVSPREAAADRPAETLTDI